MALILYEAKDAKGAHQVSRIEAATLEDAKRALEAQGYRDIRFHNSPGLVSPRAGAAQQSPEVRAQVARFELALRQNPGWANYFRELLRLKRWEIAAGLAAAGTGAGLGWRRLFVLGVIGLFYAIVAPLWGRRNARQHSQMMRCYAYGDWKTTLWLMNKLKPQTKKLASMRLDFEFRQAVIRLKTKQTRLPDEAKTLTPLRQEMDFTHPGMFDARYAAVALAAGNPGEALAASRRALAAKPEESSYLVDLAVLEARIGSVEAAEALLTQVESKVLAELAKPFVLWAKGLIALRRGSPDAEALLAEAVQGVLANTSTAALPVIGLVSGAYIITLLRRDAITEARAVTRQVSPLLKIWGDRALLKMLPFEMKEAERRTGSVR